MQQKDVIYIDVEDDITAIIGKVKGAKEKIVALVPPKRIGVLQSAVNLRLLMRAAEGVDKRLVLITANSALTGLAASAKIPVAKNLQSRPEIPEAPAVDDDEEDVIDGEQLPIGEHADSVATEEAIPAGSINNLDIDGETAPVKPRAAAGAAVAAQAKRKGIKVPDFGTFRKKAALIAAGGVLLVLFLIWAIVIAPHATVVISAKTSNQALNVPVTVGASLTTDSDKATIKSIVKTEKTSQSVDFDATGKKDVGDKASGTVTFSTGSIGDLGTTIPANTQLSASNGLSYLTTQSVTISFSNYNGATSGIVAVESGTKYNGASGQASGAPGHISANITGATSGGTDKTITIVLQADVQKAQSQLANQNSDDMKNKLKGEFANDMVVVDSSFTVTGGDSSTSSPDVGQEDDSGKAKLTRDMTYTLSAIPKSELGSFLDGALQKTLTNKNQQRVYDNGLGTAQLTDYKAGDNSTASANLGATGQVGPQIDDNQIKQEAKGKRFGDIQQELKSIDGISDVSLNLSPFWVQSAPNDVNKISIEFKLIKNNG